MAISSRNDLRRRGVLGLLLGAAALPLVGTPAHALTDGEARALIDRVVSDINRIINSGQSERAMYGDFERLFDRYADVPTIARSALGPAARSASRAQLAAFGDAFGAYLARKYGARFREFIGGSIQVTDARQLKNFVEVRSTVDLRGQAPFSVSFMVSDRSGADKFFDIVIEGISLLKTERVEIGSMLERRRGNVDQLIQDLRSA
ncbi:MAG: ABC transporter substrate-binding protein [Paracoccaceae bacterium]|nr:ABC transporter substrate-binding protein [Paracoccaceae bacterium]